MKLLTKREKISFLELLFFIWRKNQKIYDSNVWFILYSKLLSNFGCLFTFCYLDGARPVCRKQVCNLILIWLGKSVRCWHFLMNIHSFEYLQGLPSGFDIIYLALADTNMVVIFGLKVVWGSWVRGIWLMTLWFG